MMKIAQLTYVIAMALFLSSCGDHKRGESNIDIQYPQPMPDSTILSFLPGVVSTDSLDFNAAFSPDGKSFYFSRSEKKKLTIYVTHRDGKQWTTPVRAPFSRTEYSDADPAFSPDGKIYFISNRPGTPSDTLGDYDIWFVSPAANGAWSDAENLKSINTDSSEFYISFSKSGTMYFSSSREGGYGAEDIYRSEIINGQYGDPKNLGPEINSDKSDYDPGISPDEDMIVFTSSGRSDTFGGSDLYAAVKSPEGQWKKASNLGSFFNTKGREYCSYFSPDLRFFFFTSGKDVKWVDRKILMQHAQRASKLK